MPENASEIQALESVICNKVAIRKRLVDKIICVFQKLVLLSIIHLIVFCLCKRLTLKLIYHL
jgi:hypothetical protein